MEYIERGDLCSGLRADGGWGVAEKEGEGKRGGGMEVRRDRWQW